MARKICFILAIHSSLEGVKGTDKRLQELSSLWREGTETAELCLDNRGRNRNSKTSSVVNPRPGRWLAEAQGLKEPW